MERVTYYDIDWGDYYPITEEYKLAPPFSSLYFKLINKIGELEDKIEELEKNGVNEETRGRIKSGATAI